MPEVCAICVFRKWRHNLLRPAKIWTLFGCLHPHSKKTKRQQGLVSRDHVVVNFRTLKLSLRISQDLCSNTTSRTDPDSQMNWIEILGAFSSTATAIGVFFAWSQIKSSKHQNRTQFEDSLAREYRELTQKFPVKALLGEELDEVSYNDSFHLFYHYIDLSNEQIFLRSKNRVSRSTWENWQDGIRSNLSLPAVQKAWQEIKKKSPSRFDELRKLEELGFQSDPREWKGPARISATSRLDQPAVRYVEPARRE